MTKLASGREQWRESGRLGAVCLTVFGLFMLLDGSRSAAAADYVIEESWPAETEAEEYAVKLGDAVFLTVRDWALDGDPPILSFRVDSSGGINLPIAGFIDVSGMRVRDVMRAVVQLARDNNILRDGELKFAVVRESVYKRMHKH